MTLEVWERPAAEAELEGRGVPRASRRRRVLTLVGVSLAVLAVLGGILLVASRGDRNRASLDPDNAGDNGTRAITRVLADRGVRVDVARGQDELLAGALPDARTTVVITRSDAFSERTARTAWEHLRGAGRVVLVAPSRFALESLGVQADPASGAPATRSVAARCSLSGVSPDDTITGTGAGYASARADASTCFGFEGGASLVRLPARAGEPEVTVLGADDILTNGEITRYDNAGVAVRLLGSGDRVLWHIPSPLDISVADQTPTSELPRALGPLILLAGVALLVAMLWRGRRFGPLVTEPLPAVVKAIETTQSRGRLYRRARDTGRAAAVLRAATTRRLAAYLGLPPRSHPAVVAEAASAATGRPLPEVQALLHGPPPANEDALTALADDLSALEEEVRHP